MSTLLTGLSLPIKDSIAFILRLNFSFSTIASLAHSWFHYFLRSISLDESSYELLVKIIKHEFNKIDKKNGVGPKHREKLKNLEAKLLKIQDLYIDGDLTKEEYQNHKKQLQNLISEVKDRQIQFSKKKEVLICTKMA